jgi:tRNA(fMet)-specific endonuclease VapC
MILHVLDTDTLSLLQRGHPSVLKRCSAKVPGELAITVISVQEQLSGRLRFIGRVRKPDELHQAYQSLIDTMRSLSKLPVISFSPASFARYGHLVGLKLNVGRMDLRIAATALEHGGVLVTRNLRDFGRVPGLGLEGLVHLILDSREESPIICSFRSACCALRKRAEPRLRQTRRRAGRACNGRRSGTGPDRLVCLRFALT